MTAQQHLRIRLKRAYTEPSRDDGYRVLVDGLWPRGIKKETLQVEEWCRDLAPSGALRRWFGHRPEHWAEFRERYLAELKQHPDEIRELLEKSSGRTLTLVYGARDEEHNNAVVLREFLSKQPVPAPAKQKMSAPAKQKKPAPAKQGAPTHGPGKH